MRKVTINGIDYVKGNHRYVKISAFANGRITYQMLSEMVGNMILNNTIYTSHQIHWDTFCGNDYDEANDEYIQDPYQTYLISRDAAEFLRDETNEIVYYNEDLNLYLWCIYHFGTCWDCVSTGLEIKE